MKSYSLSLLLLLTLTLAGCASIGPGSVTRDRFDYGESLAESWKRQLLLNIVKMRYAEPLFFMDVGQIVAGYSLESDISLSATVGTVANVTNTASINPGLAGKYTDRPTITYVPLTGNAFLRNLMTPMSPEKMMSAIQSGIPADMLFKLGVASINGLRNRSAPVAGFRPAEQKFLRVVEILRSLQLSGALRVKTIKAKDNTESAIISFASKGAPAETSMQIRELRDLLGLDPGTDRYALVNGNAPEGDRQIAMQAFSLMHLLSFLAAQVEVPGVNYGDGRQGEVCGQVLGRKAGGRIRVRQVSQPLVLG
jgi:hypothetical protein